MMGDAKKAFWKGAMGGVLICFLGFLGIFSYQALKNLANDSLTMAAARVVGLPAGFVNGHYLSYADFQEDLMAVRHFYNFQLSKNPDFVVPPIKEMQKGVWDRMARQVILKEQAKSADVAVSVQEIDEEFDKLVKDFGSKEEAEKILKETYGWSGAQFKNKVLEPFLLQEKVIRASSTLDLEALYQKSKVWKWIKI